MPRSRESKPKKSSPSPGRPKASPAPPTASGAPPSGGGAPGLLDEYTAKRAFNATPEPPPAAVVPRHGPLLFVIQQHAARAMHYDVRLEVDGVLKSWPVPKGPSPDPAEKRLAVMTEDHPYDYASFEGIIPPGQYGAGEVIVWDCGVYSPDEGGTWFHDRAAAEARMRDGIAKGKLSVTFRGEKMKGSWAFVRLAKDPKNWLLIKHKDRFVSKADLTAQNRSVLSGATVEEMKVVPARRIPASRLVPNGDLVPLPAGLEPMHAEIGPAAFNHPDWMWEPKLDGYRVLAFIDGATVRLRSRRGQDLGATFPRIVEELGKQAAGSMILDGEIVAFEADGRPSFHAMQNRAQAKTPAEVAAAEQAAPAVYYCFDLLYFAGVDLRRAPYRDRRRYLSQCLLPTPRVLLVHASEDGVALNEASLASGFEGVVGKRKDSRYEAGRRSSSWLKIKPVQTADFVVGGWTTGKGSRTSLGAILVGYWEKKRLVFASHVGSGFDDRTVTRLKKALQAIERKTCPFAETPELTSPTTWVEPRLVVEVKFHSFTPDGHLRAPVYIRMRDDLDPRKVGKPSPRAAGAGAITAVPDPPGPGGRPSAGTRGAPSDPGAAAEIAAVVEQLDRGGKEFPLVVGPHRIRLTTLDRVYWPADASLRQPALTKRDLLRYLAQISPYMLPHLRDRPLTMIRMPDGITGHRFFQKHWEQERPPFAEKITVFSGHKDERHDYLLCNNLPTLLWLGQSGTLEFHVWHSRATPGPDAEGRGTDYASSLEALETSLLGSPDFLVFDLDPYIYSGQEKPGDEPELNNVAFEKGKEVAFRLRDLLQSMSLEAIVKTSGKTGLHVFVPIRRTIDFDKAREICEIVGRHLMRMHPKDITMEWSVPKRTGKIFLDYNMNARGKTLNVAYSPRGAAGAPVSMPLTWEELAGAHPLDFRITNAAARLAQTGDRWRDALKRKQSLERVLEGSN